MLALYKRSIAGLPGELVDLIPNLPLELAQVTETDLATCSAKVDVKLMDLSMLVEMVSRTIVGCSTLTTMRWHSIMIPPYALLVGLG